MGGRFDATNVVEPSVSVITTISGEHKKFLGETLSQIAFEKAGIVKCNIPVVCGVEQNEALETIKRRAEELKAPFHAVFAGKRSFITYKTEKGYSFVYKTDKENYSFTPSLQGKHQGENAAVAIAASEQLSKAWKELEKKRIVSGVEKTKWEGRLEIVSRNPLVILDGAHNEEGVRALKRYFEDFPSSPLILVFAIMRDKEITKIADILFPLAKKIILTRFPLLQGCFARGDKEAGSKFPGSNCLRARHK